jgi:hypothetical protein
MLCWSARVAGSGEGLDGRVSACACSSIDDDRSHIPPNARGGEAAGPAPKTEPAFELEGGGGVKGSGAPWSASESGAWLAGEELRPRSPFGIPNGSSSGAVSFSAES